MTASETSVDLSSPYGAGRCEKPESVTGAVCTRRFGHDGSHWDDSVDGLTISWIAKNQGGPPVVPES